MKWIKFDYKYGNTLINVDAIDAITINEHACTERYCKNNDELIDCDKCKYSGYNVNILIQGRCILIKTFDNLNDAENLKDSILQQINKFLTQPIVYELKVE